MIVIYQGTLPAGTALDPATGTEIAFVRGEPLELPDEMALKLIEQNCGWREPRANKKETT